jgi:hypothetical protein
MPSPALIASWVLAGCGVTLTGLRLYARYFIARQFGLDDVLIACATVSILQKLHEPLDLTRGQGFTVAYTVLVTHAQRAYEAGDFDIVVGQRPFLIWTRVSYLMSANMIHSSWICFYYRIVKDTGIQSYRNVLHAYIAAIFGLFAVFLGLTVNMST